MITTSRTRGGSVVWAASAAWNSDSFAVTSGCRRKALNGPIRRPSSVVAWTPNSLAYTTQVALSASKRSRCALVKVAGSASGSRPPRDWLGLVIVAAPYLDLGCGLLCRMFLSAVARDGARRPLEWPSAWRAIFHGEFDAHESGGPEDPIRGQFHPAAVGGDVGDMAVIIGPASPVDARWADNLVGEGLAGHDGAPQARSARLQRHAFDDVVRMPGEVGDAQVFIQAEVIHGFDVGDIFGFPDRFMRGRVDRHAHEEFLR